MAPCPLNNWARSAIADAQEEHQTSNKTEIVDPNSNRNTANQISISIAKKFLTRASPKFLESESSKDEDRLVKIGRSVIDLVSLVGRKDNSIEDEEETLKLGLGNIVEQCNILASENLHVPKKRFGKTGVDMPVVTLGCMRFQQTWDSSVTDFDKVNPEGQANLVKLLHYAITKLGINHIETARMYGTSELQLGNAFAKILDMGIKREELIIQTKVNAMPAKDFRAALEKSFEVLGLDYVDLFSFHGINMEFSYKLIFDNEGDENLMDIVKEYQAAGKIKHIGFSTHGQPELVRKCIETDEFDYANLHYHAFGSYTASGGGQFGGNLENVRLMNEKDMGVFIISPYDKGGRLYAPSNKLRSLTLPDLEPIQYGGLWLFNHGEMDTNADIHTFTVGAARPSDLDEPSVAAYLYANRKQEMVEKVENVSNRLKEAEVDVLGEDWLNNCYKGLTNCLTEDDAYNFGQIIMLHNLIKSFGMLDYAIDRYQSFDDNVKNWDFNKTTKENITSGNRVMWGYMPGIPVSSGKDYAALLPKVPEEQKSRVLEALTFVFDYCSKSSDKKDLVISDEWKTAYDMRPWAAFPERG